MTSDALERNRGRVLALVVLDALTYAAVVALVATVVSLVLGVATGGGVVRGKRVLFVLGFGLMTYATVRLWPTSVEDVTDGPGDDAAAVASTVPRGTDEGTRFQRLVAALPPVRWVSLPSPDDRLSPAGKLFLGSVLALLVSFAMEVGFGVM